MFEVPDIPGAADVVTWFGYWPRFHDAEVLSIKLDRFSGCEVVIHAFETTPEIDARGYFVLAKHAIVTFSLEGFPQDQYGIVNTRIEFFNHQNALSSVRVNKTLEGYELLLDGIYGVDGSISCDRMSVRLEPGLPPHPVHRPSAGN